MTELSDAVADVVALYGGRLVTKIRLQKTFYFLDAAGLLPDAGDLGFEYHYYGPYSETLSIAAEDAVAGGKLSTGVVRGYHSEPYTTFESEADRPLALSDDRAEPIRRALAVCRMYSGIELEVASSIHFLRHQGYDDPVSETRSRKPLKTTDKRIARAKTLIETLEGLPSTVR